MINNVSKLFLAIYVALLIIILLTPSEGFGLLLLIGTGLFSMVFATFIANNVKKFTGSFTSRVLTIIFVNLILYSAIFVVYGLGNIGMGAEKNLTFLVSRSANTYLLVISLIIGLILVALHHKDQVVESKPNKKLALILVVVLVILFYSETIEIVASLTSNPNICSMQIEIKSDSFIFVKGMKDACINMVARQQAAWQ